MLPEIFVSFLAIVGAFTTTAFITWFIKNFLSKYYYKEPYMSPDQKKYFMLLEENKKLKEKISSLEIEAQQITDSLLKHIQG